MGNREGGGAKKSDRLEIEAPTRRRLAFSESTTTLVQVIVTLLGRETGRRSERRVSILLEAEQNSFFRFARGKYSPKRRNGSIDPPLRQGKRAPWAIQTIRRYFRLRRQTRRAW